jgi:hypothetical protein
LVSDQDPVSDPDPCRQKRPTKREKSEEVSFLKNKNDISIKMYIFSNSKIFQFLVTKNLDFDLRSGFTNTLDPDPDQDSTRPGFRSGSEILDAPNTAAHLSI